MTAHSEFFQYLSSSAMLSQGNYVLSVVSIIAILRPLIPLQLRNLLCKTVLRWWNSLTRTFNRYTVVEIHREQSDGLKVNKFYRDVHVYLSTLDGMREMDYLRVHRCSDTSRISFSLPPDEAIVDTFEGAQLLWTHYATEKPESQQQAWWSSRGRRESSRENKSFSLKLLKSDRARILSRYLDHISKVVKEVEHRNTQRKLHTNMGQEWEEVEFNHPSTFETLALSNELKEKVITDLKTFSEGELFYHKVGRAWKRGYLLYGPPGTGKSSMIAAMANFLHYDIYDLELTNVSENSDLKSLLIQTKRKSIIVIEDIDCSLDLSDRGTKSIHETVSPNDPEVAGKTGSKITLSGLLNFTDGLWSCCGEERIFVFTTNHKDRLDEALVRSGRMDLHILLPYCTFSTFRVLAQNYLGLKQEHELYKSLEKKMNNSKITPAAVVEMLISNKEKPDAALRNVMAALKEDVETSPGDLPSPRPPDGSPKRSRSFSGRGVVRALRSLRERVSSSSRSSSSFSWTSSNSGLGSDLTSSPDSS